MIGWFLSLSEGRQWRVVVVVLVSVVDDGWCEVEPVSLSVSQSVSHTFILRGILFKF